MPKVFWAGSIKHWRNSDASSTIHYSIHSPFRLGLWPDDFLGAGHAIPYGSFGVYLVRYCLYSGRWRDHLFDIPPREPEEHSQVLQPVAHKLALTRGMPCGGDTACHGHLRSGVGLFEHAHSFAWLRWISACVGNRLWHVHDLCTAQDRAPLEPSYHLSHVHRLRCFRRCTACWTSQPGSLVFACRGPLAAFHFLDRRWPL